MKRWKKMPRQCLSLPSVTTSSLSMPLDLAARSQMLEMLDNHFASSRTATRISVPTSIFTKQLNRKSGKMSSYMYKFETLFTLLERVGDEAEIPEFPKAPLLLAGMGSNWQLTPQKHCCCAPDKKKRSVDIGRSHFQLNTEMEPSQTENCIRKIPKGLLT